MKIILNKLKIHHFKGIKALDVSFTFNTNILGDNATGKTSVMDAFLWLLFGKDSTDRTAFEVKHIKKGNNRIGELEHQQQKLAQEVARLEKIEFTIQEFERAKVEAIEKKVNAMFEITRWKLFEQQINGQEVPTCKATHKQVPYADLNSAAKANVGLDIINTLSKHYGVTAPIFFDNREGVNHLIDTPSQLINLIVTKDPELIIENLEHHGKPKYTTETTAAH